MQTCGKFEGFPINSALLGLLSQMTPDPNIFWKVAPIEWFRSRP